MQVTELIAQQFAAAAKNKDTWGGVIVNVMDYGAKGDGVTDDTAAIQAANDSMEQGNTLLIPAGDFKITNLTFDPPDDSNLICMGTLISSANGVVFQVGDLLNSRYRYRIQGLKVVSSSRNWTAGRTGVRLVNLEESIIDIRHVEGFEKNIEGVGKNANGLVYNEIHLGRLVDGKFQLYLTADTNGWANENTFYGGRFAYTSSITDYTGCVALTVDNYAAFPLNNNRFYTPSFESLSTTVKAANISGSYHGIYHPRLEGIGTIEFTVNSSYSRITYGRGVDINAVINNGIKNKVETQDGINLVSGSATAAVDVTNFNSATNKTIISRSTVGTETYSVKGTGDVYSATQAYFRNGIRWKSSDATNNDRGFFTGTGSPEGVITARPGSMYTNESGGAGTTLYIKESGAGNTGWIAK